MVSIRATAVKGKRAKHNRLACRVNSESNNKKPGANPSSGSVSRGRSNSLGAELAYECDVALPGLGTKRHSVQANSLLDTL